MIDREFKSQIIICGRGGQGVLFLTRLLDEAVLTEGKNVISSETHGMAMRGGSVTSYIRIGKFNSPLIRHGQADVMLSLTESEALLNKHLLKKYAQVFINGTTKNEHSIDATSVALRLGSIVVTNLVLLGFACGHKEFPFKYDIINMTLRKLSTSKTLDLNLLALHEGFCIKNRYCKAIEE